jgi:8-hydroxy-5-deazaflavin:NADPH oxidoreductase
MEHMAKYGVIGSGTVGQILADGLLKHGHEVMRGSRDPKKLAQWSAGAGPHASVGNFAEAARFGSTIVLAVKGIGALEALQLAGPTNLAGKTIIDTTNPIAEKPIVDGVLAFFTGPNESLMEHMQARVPDAHFVKAFNSVGGHAMVEPDFGGVRPTMFICGNKESAKAEVRALLDSFLWESADMGTAVAARAIEPLCILWCIPGFREQSWNHAFKLLRK